MDLKDKRALITGGTSGMGSAVALAMAENGASVMITGRDETRGASAVDEPDRQHGFVEKRYFRAASAGGLCRRPPDAGTSASGLEAAALLGMCGCPRHLLNSFNAVGYLLRAPRRGTRRHGGSGAPRSGVGEGGTDRSAGVEDEVDVLAIQRAGRMPVARGGEPHAQSPGGDAGAGDLQGAGDAGRGGGEHAGDGRIADDLDADDARAAVTANDVAPAAQACR